MTETEEIEGVTLDMLAALLTDERADVNEAVEETLRSLRSGERPTAEQFTELRVAAEGLRFVVERYAVAVAEGDHRSRLESETCEGSPAVEDLVEQFE